MKTYNSEKAQDLLTVYSITIDEMLCVRGGEEDPVLKPVIPPVVL
jgi:hypothetical protein